MIFRLEIALGGDALQTSDDVRALLVRVSRQVAIEDETDIVRDLNGNTVGRWTFSEE
jgi:hypothetical protein